MAKHRWFLISSSFCNLFFSKSSSFTENTEKKILIVTLCSAESFWGWRLYRWHRFHPYRQEKETEDRGLFFFCKMKVENWSLRKHSLLSCFFPPSFCCHRKSYFKTPMLIRSSECRPIHNKKATQVHDNKSLTVLGCDGLPSQLAFRIFRENDDL